MLDDEDVSGEEVEEISDEGVTYQINTFGADYTIDGLVKRFDKGSIFKPKFQRNYVWSWPQASKFIESILLGLPIPSIFLYREEATQKHLIVDGLQRLTTLHAFQKGRFEHNDRVFRLKDVKNRYENKTLEDLDEDDQRRFEDSVIHAMIIQQMAPDDSNSSVFHIFDRLNSNGTPLQAQEIRTAVYHGKFQQAIAELNDVGDWRDIFGPFNKRAKDQEMILRFFALWLKPQGYEKPMKGFLNDFMSKNRNPSDDELKRWKLMFTETVSRANSALPEKPFRPTRTFNASVYESFMVAIARHPEASNQDIVEAYEKCVNNPEYIRMCTIATSDDANVQGRLRIASEAFE
ncbi:MAG: DUF262 domain-containing protein [Parvularcula sp.]|jgi:hypothetical protein|nr:DUF262 domain-containing protein [Parvularcula sp.]